MLHYQEGSAMAFLSHVINACPVHLFEAYAESPVTAVNRRRLTYTMSSNWASPFLPYQLISKL